MAPALFEGSTSTLAAGVLDNRHLRRVDTDGECHVEFPAGRPPGNRVRRQLERLESHRRDAPSYNFRPESPLISKSSCRIGPSTYATTALPRDTVTFACGTRLADGSSTDPYTEADFCCAADGNAADRQARQQQNRFGQKRRTKGRDRHGMALEGVITYVRNRRHSLRTRRPCRSFPHRQLRS